ncbi:MAG: hypothetical protein JST00_25380 [Deltaproteobacteria bacterium]|nr:hypothetical protein [Deltaproteobacteria bacterium]
MRQRLIVALAAVVVVTPLLATTACDSSGSGCGVDDCQRYGQYQDKATCRCVSRQLPARCTSDNDCGLLAHCLPDNTCSLGCTTAADCRRGATCGPRAACARACATSADCSAGFACTNGACDWLRTACGSGGTCPAGQACERPSGGLCGPTCGSVTCTPGFECVTDRGAAAPRCDSPDYRACTTDADCNAELGGTCTASQCFGAGVSVPSFDAGATTPDASTSDAGASDGG